MPSECEPNLQYALKYDYKTLRLRLGLGMGVRMLQGEGEASFLYSDAAYAHG